LPFRKTHIENFDLKVRKILEENENKLTVDAFGKTFDTPEWQEAFADENGKLVKFLRHSAFKTEGMGEDEIDPSFITAFALFNCVGETEQKAHVFYHLL